MLIDYDKVNWNDQKAWELICSGYTQGCFQIKSFLGRSWCKKIQPHNIEELSALISLIRPGCLEVIIDGKSVPQHYADRKNGIDYVSYFHPALEPILKSTYGMLVYQEQSIRIAKDIAGFSATEADTLRKGIGKKLAQVISELRLTFTDGCNKQGIVNTEEAAELFSWIEKSQRYAFNKCVAKYTTVETPEGIKTLEEVNIGDLVNSPFGYTKVVNKYNNGLKKVFRVTLSNKQSIDCTLDHKFLRSSLEVEALWKIVADHMGYLMVKAANCMYSHWIPQNNYIRPEKIVHIEEIGLIETMDIEVDSPEHIFYANGIATSNSHAVSYAQEAYLSAYLKAHHTLSFFRSFLNYTYEEPDAFDKISELVDDSKLFNIYIQTPDLRRGNIEFIEDPEKNIVVAGLRCIRGVGTSAITKIEELLKSREVGTITLNDWLFELWPQLSSDTCTNLISVGAFDYLGQDRKRLLFLYQNVLKLTDKEMLWALNNKNDFEGPLPLLLSLSKTKKNGGGTHSVKREAAVLALIENINNPPFSLEDDVNWIVKTEKHLLGFSSASRISLVDDYKATSSCIDLVNSRVQNACIAVEIRDVRERIIKNGDNKGKKMASLVIQDESCVIDNAVIFSDKYEEFHSLLEATNCVRMTVYKPKGKDSIIINHVEQL